MYLQRLLQINMATLAALGTLLLGMGQGDARLPLLMLIAAGSSVLLTDVTGWFRLNRTVANVAALVALVISAHELLQFGTETQVTGLARLLIYVQIILLFTEKDDRTYWQLVMLSLLQVVVAAAFSQGIWFGLLLIVYMLVGLTALALLCLHRQRSRFHPVIELPPVARAGAGRWPLAGQQADFRSASSGHDRLGIWEKGVGWELLGRLVVMGVITLGLTLFLFVTFPRSGRSDWRPAIGTARHVVAFSGKVTLGELGEIIESPEEVMTVELTHRATGRHYYVDGELYLRGAILSHYHQGQWEHRPSGNRFQPLPSVRRMPNEHWVRQRITIERLSVRDEVFCVWPFFPNPNRPNKYLGLYDDRLVRLRQRRSKQFVVELGTMALRKGVQVPLVPCNGRPDTEPLLQLPELTELTKLADRWFAQSRLPDDDRYARALELAQQFHDSKNRFQYAIEGLRRDLTVDPVEDFIAHNRRGHCEYFATALTLMLRSRKIPSRMVVGYKCGEFNNRNNFYQVRQLHAHAWVEAYLEAEHIPEELRRNDPPWRWASGGWLRLEPTPGSSVPQDAEGQASGFARIREKLEWLQSFWSDYVLEMNSRRQHEKIYRPLINAIEEIFAYLSKGQWWRGLLEQIRNALDPRQLRGPGDYRLWIAVGALAGGLLLVFRGRRIARWLWRVGIRMSGRTASMSAIDRGEVEFYRRLETLLAGHHLLRTAGQTQREFAAHAGAKIAQTSGAPRMAALPPEVVDAFYRVRFGRLPLDNARAQAVEQALAELAAVRSNP